MSSTLDPDYQKDKEELRAAIEKVYQEAEGSAKEFAKADLGNFDERFDHERAEDFLQLTYDAEHQQDDEMAIKLAKYALQLNPDLDDAAAVIAACQKTDLAKIDALKTLIANCEQKLKKDGYYAPDNIGMFWGIFETRPMLRAMLRLLNLYIEIGCYRSAIQIGEEIIRLNTNDNTGTRYTLAALYCMVEDLPKALEIACDEDNGFMFAVQLVAYFKSSKYDRVLKVAENLCRYNFYLLQLIVFRPDEEDLELDDSRWSMGSPEEAILAVKDYRYLLDATPGLSKFLLEHFADLLKIARADAKSRYKVEDDSDDMEEINQELDQASAPVENKQYLDLFKRELVADRLSPTTIRRHLSYAEMFLNDYLPGCEDREGQEISWVEYGVICVPGFLDEYARDYIDATPTKVKQAAASIKKFYACMAEQHYISESDYREICADIKEQLPEIIQEMDKG